MASVKPIAILFVEITIYSLVSLVLIYIVAFLFFDFQIRENFLKFFLFFILVMISIFSIGMMLGGIAPNMKIASTVASILYFPMLIFSGASLRYESMPNALQNFANLLHLTQGIKLLKATGLGVPIDNILFPIVLMVSIIMICTTVSLKFFKC